MKGVIVLVTSNRDVLKPTSHCLARLVAEGAERLDLDDVSDISLARNLGLSRALKLMSMSTAFDVVLCVDDDMFFLRSHAERLVTWVRENDRPASACYTNVQGVIVARRLERDRFQSGAGFLCIPRAHLEKLAVESPRGRPQKGSPEWVFAFCSSGFHEYPSGELVWEGEDFSLTRRLGGVALLPISVGHVKRQVLWADETKLAALIAET